MSERRYVFLLLDESREPWRKSLLAVYETEALGRAAFDALPAPEEDEIILEEWEMNSQDRHRCRIVCCK